MPTAEHSAWSRIGAHDSWARTVDRAARTANARKKMLDNIERRVDPDGILSPTQRAQMASSARKAYFQRLARKSVAVRKQRAGDGP